MTANYIVKNAAAVIWHDASFSLLQKPSAIVAEMKAMDCDIAAFAHPDRSRIKEEGAEIIRLGLAPADAVTRQLDEYRRCGFDTKEAPQPVLTTTGLLVIRNTPSVASFFGFWWQQIETYTLRDQLSVDFCAWITGVRIGYLPGNYRDNKYAAYDRVRHRVGRIAA